MAKEVSIVEWHYNTGNKKPFTLAFTNCITGIVDVRDYKTQAAARAAETRFHNRISRVYGNVKRPADNSYYPYM